MSGCTLAVYLSFYENVYPVFRVKVFLRIPVFLNYSQRKICGNISITKMKKKRFSFRLRNQIENVLEEKYIIKYFLLV